MSTRHFLSVLAFCAALVLSVKCSQQASFLHFFECDTAVGVGAARAAAGGSR